jgi:penicillin amidase
MKRFARRLICSLVLVTAGSMLVTVLVLQASLPQLDGEVSAALISAPITIERDSIGVPTVTAANRADLAFGTGFVHGQDRYFQMDLSRRQAAGELAEVIGPALLETDKRHRLHRFRSRAQQVVAQMSADETEIMDAYVAGVNAGLDSLGAKPFEYFILRVSPEPWRAEDTVLAAYAMYMVLNDERASNDVKRGLVHRIVDAEVYDWLYPLGTKWDAPIIGEARSSSTIPSAEQLNVRSVLQSSIGSPANEVAEPPSFGSNNWAVSGALTQNGRAIVASDMHLSLGVPNVFYRARLVTTGADKRDVSGVTLPGAPILVAGSNGHVAWGLTNSYGDWSDAVILRPGSQPDTYLTPGGERKFSEFREQIGSKGESSQELVVRETIWGPVLDDHSYPDGELAVRWLAYEVNAITLRQLDLETTSTVFEAVRIAATLGLPPQNFVAGDKDGNIAWTIAGQIPIRTEYDSSIPADWSEKEGWIGWLDTDDYPRVINPENGRIWTANARVADGDAMRKIADRGYDFGARAQQIRDDLFAKESFEPRDMLDIQFDDRAIFLTPWRDLLLSVLDAAAVRDNALRSTYRYLAEDWIPRASAESVGYRLVRAFRGEVQKMVFEGLMRPVSAAYDGEIDLLISNQFEGPLWSVLQKQPMHLLPSEYDSWQALLLQAVDRSVENFAENYDGGLPERSWGERNIAAIRHPLSQALPILSGWLDMPAEPLSGDSNMPKAQGRDWGASERFAVSPGDEANAYMHMPGGQSGHPLSDFYGAGHQDWVQGRATGFLPGATKHVLTLTVAQ